MIYFYFFLLTLGTIIEDSFETGVTDIGVDKVVNSWLLAKKDLTARCYHLGVVSFFATGQKSRDNAR